MYIFGRNNTQQYYLHITEKPASWNSAFYMTTKYKKVFIMQKCRLVKVLSVLFKEVRPKITFSCLNLRKQRTITIGKYKENSGMQIFSDFHKQGRILRGLEVACDIAARTKSAPSLCVGDRLRDPDLLCPPPLLALEIRRRRLELRLLDLRRLVGDLLDRPWRRPWRPGGDLDLLDRPRRAVLPLPPLNRLYPPGGEFDLLLDLTLPFLLLLPHHQQKEHTKNS